MAKDTWVRTQVFYDDADPRKVEWSWRVALMTSPNEELRSLSGKAENEQHARELAGVNAVHLRMR